MRYDGKAWLLCQVFFDFPWFFFSKKPNKIAINTCWYKCHRLATKYQFSDS